MTDILSNFCWKKRSESDGGMTQQGLENFSAVVWTIIKSQKDSSCKNINIATM